MEPVDLWQRDKYPKAMYRFLAFPFADSSKQKILRDNALRLYAP